MMKLSQLEAADRARRELVDTRLVLKHLEGYRVIRATIAQGENEAPEASSSIDLMKGRCGTGTLSGIGLPLVLSDMLTMALQQWARDRVANAEIQLKVLGVDLAA